MFGYRVLGFGSFMDRTPTFEVLVVAGGGSGGADDGGGGGAGGIVHHTEKVLDAGTNYTVTIGAGASASPNNSTVSSGSNSVFSVVLHGYEK